ncbi:hypothetical protein AgCh_026888 [Apium graveolens]
MGNSPPNPRFDCFPRMLGRSKKQNYRDESVSNVFHSATAFLLCGFDEPQTGMGGLGNQELPLYSAFSYNGYRAVPEKRESQGSASMVEKSAHGDVAIFWILRDWDKKRKYNPPIGWLIVRSRFEDPWFWKAHESERYVECATDTTDHQEALSLYRDRGDIAQFFLEEGWFARVTDLAIMPNRAYLQNLAFSGEFSLVKPKTLQDKFRKGSLMLEGASPNSDRSASSRKSEEVITDEPHVGKLAHVVLAGLS